MFIAFQTIDAQAQPAGKVAVCHVTFPNDSPNASGHVIEISRNACVAHCTNHGDQVLADIDCADIFPFGQDEECIVNSLNPTVCTVDRCIEFCNPI